MLALPTKPRARWLPLVAITAVFVLASGAHGGTATDVNGLYNTGENNTFGDLSGGTQDSHWAVTYASTNGGSTANATYKGSSYVVDAAANNAGHTDYIDAGWVPNAGNAQWIVPPGAMTAATGGTANTGGVYLPGNGGTGAAGQPNNTADTNEAVFVYTLAFTITGTGTGAVSNVDLTMTVAADDQYAIYVNPTGNGASIPTGTAASTGTNAWGNTTAVTLPTNAGFVIGTNYLVVVVDNTNSVTGNSGSTALNPSGLLVYNMTGFVNGAIVPEVGTWIPVAGAVGLYGMVLWRRPRRRPSLSV
jgi:hypothetical protein